eukprot:5508363-Pleurochrysis_carterae.AAC.1
MDSRSLTVAAEDPASLASSESAVVVELVGETPLGFADESILGTLDEGGRGCPCSSWVEVEHQRRWLPRCEDRAACRRRSLQE